MNLIKDVVIPYVGPGCCHDKKCKFYWYEFYHKPIEGCIQWNQFKYQAPQIHKFDSNFKIHEFMDYASYGERWRCYDVKCPCYFEGIHSRAIQGCSGHQEFCNFLIPEEQRTNQISLLFR